VNFRLTRELGYALTTDSLLTLAVDTRNLARTQPVAEFDLGGSATAFTVRTDPVHARGTHAYVALDTGELLVLDLATPSSPRIVRKLPLGLVDPRQMLAQGDHLYVADGTGGVTILDIEKPDNPSRSSILPCADARDVELQWPWLVVADGSSGLSVFDVSNPKRPAPISTVDLNGGDARANEALDVELFFQYSRSFAANPEGTRIGRTEARLLACVACGLDGVRIVDLTQPDAPIVLHGATARGAFRFARGDVRGLAVHTVFDIGTEGGGLRSAEHDYLYVLVEEGEDGNRQRRVRTYDISDPVRPRAVPDSSPRVYGGTGALHVLCAYNEPFLQHFVVAAGAGGLGTAIDVSKAPSTGTSVAATWDGVQGLRGLFLEELALDRLQDERGRWSKDISHEDCRYLTPAEMLRTLRAKVPTAAVRTDPYGFLLEERDFPRGKTR
jgi:hypothetical protein